MARARCFYCLRTARLQDLTRDHIVPRVLGGHDGAGNIIPACKPCNNEKGDQLVAIFLAEHGITPSSYLLSHVETFNGREAREALERDYAEAVAFRQKQIEVRIANAPHLTLSPTSRPRPRVGVAAKASRVAAHEARVALDHARKEEEKKERATRHVERAAVINSGKNKKRQRTIVVSGVTDRHIDQEEIKELKSALRMTIRYVRSMRSAGDSAARLLMDQLNPGFLETGFLEANDP